MPGLIWCTLTAVGIERLKALRRERKAARGYRRLGIFLLRASEKKFLSYGSFVFFPPLMFRACFFCIKRPEMSENVSKCPEMALSVFFCPIMALKHAQRGVHALDKCNLS